MPRSFAALLVFLLFPRAADAAETQQTRGTCAPSVSSWMKACEDAEHVTLEPAECFPDRVIVDVKGEAALRVDIARDGSRAFRRVGSAGLSPIGQFEDWNTQPEPRRRALDALAACLSRDASLLESPALPAADAPKDAGRAEARPENAKGRTDDPWASRLILALAGVVAGIAASSLWRQRRAARGEPDPRPAPAAPSAPATGGRFHVSPPSLLLLLGTVVLVELWAIRAADPDFFMPDPFHFIAAGSILVFVIGGFVRHSQVRRGLVTLAIAAPLVLLAVEWRLAAAHVDNRRVAPSKDGLLRYTYRPGTPIETSEGESIVVTEDGLWDTPHAVPKPADVLRVVVLGDSVPNDPAIPFRRRFPRQLEALLGYEAPAGKRIEVVNVSCEGYNTAQEVRLLETVGLRYEPDLVIVAYVLNDAFLQNGGYRRVGNSFFAFHLGNVVVRRKCPLFEEMHAGQAFELVVRASFARLHLLADKHHFPVLVAPLPVLQPFDDPSCLAVYDRVVSAARAEGFSAGRVVDAFQGEDYRIFAKPTDALDLTHPNAEGHDRMARRIAELAAPLLSGRGAP